MLTSDDGAAALGHCVASHPHHVRVVGRMEVAAKAQHLRLRRVAEARRERRVSTRVSTRFRRVSMRF